MEQNAIYMAVLKQKLKRHKHALSIKMNGKYFLELLSSINWQALPGALETW